MHTLFSVSSRPIAHLAKGAASIAFAVLSLSAASGCGGSSDDGHAVGDGAAPDAFIPPAPSNDGGAPDATSLDATTPDDVTVSPIPPDDAGQRPVDAGTDATIDAGSDSGFETATHTLLQIPNNGGPVFASPTLVTITYQGDPQRTFDEGIGAYLIQSPWLQAVGPEYGVGTGTHVPLELAQTAPQTIDDSAIQALIGSLIANGSAPIPDGGTSVPVIPASSGGTTDDAGSDDAGNGMALMPPALYMLYVPSSTTETADGEPLCEFSGGGYHGQGYGTYNGYTFAYAVVTQCPGAQQSDLEQAVSHELIEAATDPSGTAPAWSITDGDDVWSLFGGEVGDLCSFVVPQWAEGGYTGLQRVYSDKAAAAGGDPCLPSSTPYFSTDQGPPNFIAMNAGETKTIQVTGWSSAPVPDWTIFEQGYVSGGGSTADGGDGEWAPPASLGATSLNNGETTTLKITVPAGTPSGAYALIAVGSEQSETNYNDALVGVYVP